MHFTGLSCEVVPGAAPTHTPTHPSNSFVLAFGDLLRTLRGDAMGILTECLFLPPSLCIVNYNAMGL